MVNELAPCIFFGRCSYEDGICRCDALGASAQFDGHDVPVEDEEVVHGLARLRQFTQAIEEGDDSSTGSSHGSLQICSE